MMRINHATLNKQDLWNLREVKSVEIYSLQRGSQIEYTTAFHDFWDTMQKMIIKYNIPDNKDFVIRFDNGNIVMDDDV